MVTSNVVRVGIIGTGVGVRTLLPGFSLVANAKVVGLVGSSPERGKVMAEKCNLRPYATSKDLCESDDVDLVCVASPNVFHHDDVSSALANGKHVLAEKPLAMNTVEICDLLESAGRSRRVAVVDHQLRFNPYMRTIREVISRGDIGRVYYIRLHQQGTGFSDLQLPWTWSFDADLGGGVRLAMASHLIDLARYWLGSRRVCTVTGGMDVVVAKRRDTTGDEVSVRASSFFGADLSFGSDLRVQLSATAAAFSGSRFDCEVYGTEGELRFDLSSKLRRAGREIRGRSTPVDVSDVFQDEAENRASIFSGSFRYFAPRLVLAVAAADSTLLPEASTFQDALENQRILDAVKESAQKGKSVVLDDGYAKSTVV